MIKTFVAIASGALFAFMVSGSVGESALGQSAGPTPDKTNRAIFRLSLSLEPTGIDPNRISSSESNYFLVNVLRGLYFTDKNGIAKPELAEKCRWKKPHLILSCFIAAQAKWSDGQAILAKDFVYSWRRLVNPDSKGLGIAILASVKNARAAHSGKVSSDQLGVRAIDSRELEITLEKEDPEFIQKLAHPALAVVLEGYDYSRKGATAAPVSGPYKVTEWKSSSRIHLEPNPFYGKNRKGLSRPPVEILVLDDDETAFNLYREGTLTFLRRLPTHYLKSYKGSKELYQIPVARFDYIGFGPEVKNQPEFRKAIAKALNYPELQILYDALGVPGCPGIDPAWLDKVPCHQFEIEQAKRHWEKVPSDLKTKRWTLTFSKLGGDDNQKGMEWTQAQLKNNLGMNIDLRAVEQGTYVQELRTNPPALFRKGVGLDRTSCLAAVEIFSRDDAENYLRLDSSEYEMLLENLSQASSDSKRRQLCTKTIRYLIDNALIIPTGRIHFSLLAKPEFKGWVLNPLNQLDLSNLSEANSIKAESRKR